MMQPLGTAPHWRRFVVASFATALLGIVTVCRGQDASREELDFFENQIRPVLVEHCLACHGSKKSEAGLRLDQPALLLSGGDSGPAIVPGEPRQSLLIQAVRHEGDLEMPPDQQLAPAQIQALERWIEKGAVWPAGTRLGSTGVATRTGPITDGERQWWALQPLGDPQPPQVAGDHSPSSNIDRFLNRQLADHGLAMRSPASRRQLLRRATFDLTGLPPTPEEMDAFLSDDSPQAFARVVDRLLESPAYGERWGRHWLDVVRYADTAGETADYPTPLAYKYRNWVIDAFNRDLPYDEFVRQQIAGDLLAERWVRELTPDQGLSLTDEQLAHYAQMVTATGYIAISRRFGFDVENYHHLTIQDTIDTVGQSILGLSLGCARCHDHKYDPVNMTDYYAWYGIFESTRYSFPGSEEKKRPYDMFPTVPAAIAELRQREYDARLASVTGELERLTASRQALAEQFAAIAGSTRFVGFESETLGQPPQEPWRPLGAMTIAATAQSPFRNVFGEGGRGVTSPGNADNNAVGCVLEPSHTVKSSPVLYYNIDFRNLDDGGGSDGAYRFYLGRGPGHSAAVEMAANRTTFFVKNGANYEAVCELEVGRWYNLQVVLDLKTKTYLGTIGDAQQATAFAEKQFTDGWDGTIDYTFVDRYGPGGGATPGRDLDNLAVATFPLLPVSQSIDEHPESRSLSRWQSYLEKRRLAAPTSDREGHVGFDVWASEPLPMVGFNRSQETLTVPGTVPPGTLVVHPQQQEGVGIAWRSPIAGRVRIVGKVQDAHDCGDGVAWHLDRLAVDGLQPLGAGAINANGGQEFAETAAAALADIEVNVGDFVQLAIMPKTNYGCDLTRVEFTVHEVDGDRSWDLVSDVAPDLLESNPHRDQFGHAATWFFYQVEVDRGKAFGGAVPSDPSKIDTAQLREQIDGLTTEIDRATGERDSLQRQVPFERIYGALDSDTVADAAIQLRGEKTRPGDRVARRNLEILGAEPVLPDAGSGRLQMADWLTRAGNPLTARVMVNRIWQHHFGRGIVGTENDFGTRGELPTHPELLDWLASRFIESGWSVKSLHRLIMNSAAYQQSAEFDSQAAEIDPEARLLWRFNRRRLSAEEIRDAMLSVAGQLDASPGGEHPFPPADRWGYTQHSPYYGVYATNRRSVYLMQQRLKRHPFLGLFDGADTNASTARRSLTTVPTQALFLMNDPFVHQCAAGLAERVSRLAGDEDQRVTSAHEIALGHPADEAELAAARTFLQRYRAALGDVATAEREQAAWAALARSLLTRNEFLYVD